MALALTGSELFWILLFWIPVTAIWVVTLFDIFRRPGMSGVARAVWVVAVIVLPVIGTVIYLISRPSSGLLGVSPPPPTEPRES